MKRKIVSSALLALLLQGCFPQTLLYPHLEAPDARYFKNGCHGAEGAASVIYYPFHGIYISLGIAGSLRMGIHLPEGMVAQINGRTLKIEGRDESNRLVEFTGELTAEKQGSIGTAYPNELLEIADPFSSPDNFGPLVGATKNGRYKWYFYTIKSKEYANGIARLPKGLLQGTVELPSITVNGSNYGAQTIPFKQDSSFEFTSINC